MIYYIRDDNNHLIGFRYYNRMNEETYYYVKNAQEDIIGILDSDYNKIATYEYDAWGKIVSIKDSNNNEITDSNHIAHINPFRYRSYYYDEETKLYYLNSRYYDPNFGRFINSDSIIAGGKRILLSNMYAYTENNPVINIDSTGDFATIAIIGTIIGVTVGTSVAIGKMIGHHNTRGEIKLRDWLQYTSEGAQVTSSIMSFGFLGQNIYDTASFYHNTSKIAQTQLVAPPKIHNNSLNSTKPADGYALVPRNNPSVILKYGETTMGTQRYTQKYLNNLVPGGAIMDFRASGTKYEMHYWQHNMILEYTEMHGKRPPFNKSDWSERGMICENIFKC